MDVGLSIRLCKFNPYIHYYVVFCPFLSQIVSIPPPVVLVVVPINIDYTSNMLLELLIFNVCQF